MTKTEAKAQLRVYGIVAYRGVVFRQKIKRVNGWDEFIPLWAAIKDGDLIAEANSIKAIFDAAEPYFD